MILFLGLFFFHFIYLFIYYSLAYRIAGFDAYCGFMHVESTHTNPVAMVFISILQAESLTSLKRKKSNNSDIIPLGEMCTD